MLLFFSVLVVEAYAAFLDAILSLGLLQDSMQWGMCLGTFGSVRARCQDIPVAEGSRRHPLVRPQHGLARIFGNLLSDSHILHSI